MWNQEALEKLNKGLKRNTVIKKNRAVLLDKKIFSNSDTIITSFEDKDQ